MTREQGGSMWITWRSPDGTPHQEPLNLTYDNGKTWHPNPKLPPDFTEKHTKTIDDAQP